MPQQIIIIYAGIHGFLDNVPVEKVRAFEKELLSIVQMEHSGLLDEIEKEKVLNEDNKPKIEAALKECLTLFVS